MTDLKGMCIVEFYGDACASCHAVMPVLSALAPRFGYRFIRVDLEADGAAAEKYSITRVPTAILMDDGKELSQQFKIETRVVDLTEVKNKELEVLENVTTITDAASANIAPRLRMITLYTIAASENRIVAGTGNRSEAYMGYFTKWGDGAYDFNPIADLTATEVFEFLRYLNAPSSIIEKAPSAGLFEGQTDEKEMGVTYKAIDKYITEGKGEPEDVETINRYHLRNLHKRKMPEVYACFEEDLK